ncbi:DNA polymerase III subunit delta [Roseateles sp. BYS180W]|uniref:DNA polymerase III subunit delta n=1 Tax=Roseateles rivi TaxID=3299028 RepID=A0ABW7FUD9_9BURK
MQIKADTLGAQLAKGLKPCYLIHGDEALLAQEAADSIRAAARQAGYSERHVFTVSGAHFDWAPVLATAQAMSLFADRQLIEIRIPSGKPGKEGSEALQRYAQAAPQDVLTLITLPRLDKTQLSSAWFTALEQWGVSLRVDPVERRELPAWIARRLAAQGQGVAASSDGQQALEFFADRVEGNLLAAHQELQKLALLYPRGELTQAQIEAAVLDVARFDVFKLSEAVLSGQTARVLRMLHGLQAEGEAAVLVHWTLAEDIRALKRARDAMAEGKPLPLALREARVWGPKERLFERVLPQLDDHSLRALVQAAQVCDGIVKGLRHPEWPAEPWQALSRLALQLAQLGPQRSRTAA